MATQETLTEKSLQMLERISLMRRGFPGYCDDLTRPSFTYQEYEVQLRLTDSPDVRVLRDGELIFGLNDNICTLHEGGMGEIMDRLINAMHALALSDQDTVAQERKAYAERVLKAMRGE